jgi:hypothetical protein
MNDSNNSKIDLTPKQFRYRVASALTSGKYHKIQGTLRSTTIHDDPQDKRKCCCALGVCCEEFIKSGGNLTRIDPRKSHIDLSGVRTQRVSSLQYAYCSDTPKYAYCSDPHNTHLEQRKYNLEPDLCTSCHSGFLPKSVLIALGWSSYSPYVHQDISREMLLTVKGILTCQLNVTYTVQELNDMGCEFYELRKLFLLHPQDVFYPYTINLPLEQGK